MTGSDRYCVVGLPVILSAADYTGARFPLLAPRVVMLVSIQGPKGILEIGDLRTTPKILNIAG